MSDKYQERVQLEFVEIYPGEVPTQDWAFAAKLNELSWRWKYLRRVLRLVECTNPKTGKLDIRFTALVDSDSGDPSEYAGSDEAEAAAEIDEQFFDDGRELNVALCDALCELSAGTYSKWIADSEGLIDEDLVPLLLDRAKEAAAAKAEGSWPTYSHFLWYLECCYAVLAKWEEKLWQLRLGETLSVWRYQGSAQGAREGGIKSGVTRSKAVAITAEGAIKLRDELLSQGRPERSVARIIAQRHAVSPDHVRRLIRPARSRPEGG